MVMADKKQKRGEVASVITKDTACKFCGLTGLEWRTTPKGKWQLVDFEEKVHKCTGKKKNPSIKSLVKGKPHVFVDSSTDKDNKKEGKLSTQEECLLAAQTILDGLGGLLHYSKKGMAKAPTLSLIEGACRQTGSLIHDSLYYGDTRLTTEHLQKVKDAYPEFFPVEE